ncbi:MAG: SDR family NAD(P)-dependent oxidoreductase [Nitrospinota bacterium]|jgi:NAD(P)-dependent dehydrogenase (short-subunit alcohol dehydrogenase family)|nr:SDR family NAD(P)-dependent oxidoreductase [Nitrospinota bacterium]MDP7167140.1 SDR family NAD(P)-dependent oxidoreductase [Nitrospinota bacterium]MDP7369756.1 SDR family NAD(P)-dependent oxidoreductase [Nitrospinota bacterium]MDP7663415.1 SDR family NAD(P)-dependent oxidoreductase [Nitrospinota bacterium]
MRLNGKVAIVTGASQGIGQVIAQVVAREGAVTILAARSGNNLKATSEMIADAGGESHVTPVDITDEVSVKNLMDETVSRFGTLDILINNAGVAGPMKAVEEISAEEWEECFAVNVTGMFLCCKHAIPVMKEKRSGRIVNISSLSGKRPLVHRSPYTASKMAVIGLTRTLAFEVGEFGVTVNTVCPGATEGERIRLVIENESKALGISLEEAERNFTGAAALKTFVTPEDTANMCVFLCSEEGRHMTGQDINVTAGLCWY